MRLQITCILIFSALWSQAQIFDFHIPLRDSTGNFLQLSTENYFSAEKINNEFQNKLLFGGHISEDMINYTSGKLKNKNAFGGYSSSMLRYSDLNRNLFGVKRLGYSVSIGEHLFAYGNIPRALFNFTFSGNNTDDTLYDFSESKLEMAHYQSVGFGLIDKKTGSNFNLSLLHGSSFQDITVQESELNSYNGDSLSLYFAGAYKMSDTAKRQFFSGNGWGINMDFDLILPIDIYKKDSSKLTWYISISADNIGFVKWSDQTLYYGQDTTYRFQGFEVNGTEVSSFPDSNIVDTLNIKTKKDGHFMWLPTRIWVRKLIDHNSPLKVQSYFGIGFWSIPQFTPMFYAGVYYRAAKWWAGSLNLSYGGFGSIKVGFRNDFYINDQFHILLSSNDMVGLISNKIGFGRSLNFGLQWHF